MSCSKTWTALGWDNTKPLHDLDNDHLINVIRFCTAQKVEFFIRLVGKSSGFERFVLEAKGKELQEFIPHLEQEAIRRGLSLEKIYETLEHPDPREL